MSEVDHVIGENWISSVSGTEDLGDVWFLWTNF
jgi:hypothetical protein